MPLLVIPNVFVNGTIADATQVNADFNAVAGVVNGLDHFNIGPAGFYASQIIPTNNAQATFGGTVGYTFDPNNAAAVPLTVQGATSQSVPAFRVQNQAGANQVYVDQNYDLHAINNFFNSSMQLGNSGAIFFNSGAAGTNITTHAGITDIATGCHFDGTNYIADTAITLIMRFDGGTNPALICFADVGLTVGSPFTPTRAWSVADNQQIQISGNGWLAFGNNNSQSLNGNGVAMFLCSGCHLDLNLGNFVADNAAASVMSVQQASASAFSFYHNDGLTVGNSFTPTLVALLDGNGNLTGFGNATFAGSVRPAGAAPFGGTRSTLWSGSGAPPTGGGAVGDFYFRSDGTAATAIYIKTGASVWTAVT